MNDSKSNIINSAKNHSKRKVAKRACLACRERKVKCDGEEEIGKHGDTTKTTRMCSNCRTLEIDCIFVKSMRGGRRKFNSTSDRTRSSVSLEESKDSVRSVSPQSRSQISMTTASASSSTTSTDTNSEQNRRWKKIPSPRFKPFKSEFSSGPGSCFQESEHGEHYDLHPPHQRYGYPRLLDEYGAKQMPRRNYASPHKWSQPRYPHLYLKHIQPHEYQLPPPNRDGSIEPDHNFPPPHRGHHFPPPPPPHHGHHFPPPPPPHHGNHFPPPPPPHHGNHFPPPPTPHHGHHFPPPPPPHHGNHFPPPPPPQRYQGHYDNDFSPSSPQGHEGQHDNYFPGPPPAPSSHPHEVHWSHDHHLPSHISHAYYNVGSDGDNLRSLGPRPSQGAHPHGFGHPPNHVRQSYGFSKSSFDVHDICKDAHIRPNNTRKRDHTQSSREKDPLTYKHRYDRCSHSDSKSESSTEGDFFKHDNTHNHQRVRSQTSLLNIKGLQRNKKKFTEGSELNDIMAIYTLSDSYSNTRLSLEEELRMHDLPEWDDVNDYIDRYYICNQPKFQLLPSKDVLLDNLSIKFDAAIFHAMIASVASAEEELCHQKYWIRLFFKYEDQLDDFGLLLGYSLISSCSIIMDNSCEFEKVCLKIKGIIDKGEIIGSGRIPADINSRQRFKYRLSLRLAWKFWLLTVLRKYRVGTPATRSPVNDITMDILKEDTILPSSDDGSLKSTEDGLTWSQVEKTDFREKHIPDSNILILCTKKLEDTINFPLEEEPINWPVTDCNLINYVAQNMLEEKKEMNICMINNSLLTSAFTLSTIEIIKWERLMRNIFPFNSATQNNSSQPIFYITNESDLKDFFTPETISTNLEHITNLQLKGIILLLKFSFDIIQYVRMGQYPSVDEKFKLQPVIGPTSFASADTQSLRGLKSARSSTKGNWYKYADFTLSASCKTFNVLCVLILLSKYLKFEKGDGKIRATSSIWKSPRFIEVDFDSNIIPLASFNEASLFKHLSVLVEFMKYKISSDFCLIPPVSNKLLDINKVYEYLRQIVSNFKSHDKESLR